MAVSLNELPNRESLERDLAAQLEKGRTVSAVFVDLDGFKEVNDQHGHDEGNRCLADVVAAISMAVGGKGRLYRVGGDEFCIAVSDCPESEAAVNAEKVRLSVYNLGPFGGITKVTASIGVATSCARTADAKALIAAADEAMYVSKVDHEKLRDYLAASRSRTSTGRHCEVEPPCRSVTNTDRGSR